MTIQFLFSAVVLSSCRWSSSPKGLPNRTWQNSVNMSTVHTRLAPPPMQLRATYAIMPTPASSTPSTFEDHRRFASRPLGISRFALAWLGRSN